jgi:hypothetical protein
VLLTQKARWGAAVGSLLLTGSALIAGCSSVIEGKPIAAPGAGPTEPSFPTPRQTVTAMPTAAPVPPPAPTSPNAPVGAIPLKPDQNGYVFIETKSGVTRCQINSASVGCEAAFTNSPMQDGEHTNGVSINANGSVQWVLGNLGAIPTVAIDYKTYEAQGWTIDASADGTRFTNNNTRHGMFVSLQKVDTF